MTVTVNTKTVVSQEEVATGVTYQSPSSSRSLTLAPSTTKEGRLVLTVNNDGAKSIIIRAEDLQELVDQAVELFA